MALDFASMLLQPTKVTPWDLGDGRGGGDKSLERQRLELMKKEFEETKRSHAEDERLRREKEAGDMARAHLAAENEKAAKLQADRSALFTEFTKQSGEGNIEAQRAMVPQMQALGMDIELEGEEDGLPRYRVGMDAQKYAAEEGARAAQTSPYGGEAPASGIGSMEEAYAADGSGETAEQSLSRIGAMGLGGETGSLLPPLGIRSSDEADPTTGLSVADRVAATYGMPGEKTATSGPDTPDFTGGVPKNVIDMGAMADATLHRLDPSLKGMVASFPDAETRRGAEEVRTGLRSSGLPFEKQAGLFDKAVGQAASQRNAQIGAEAQMNKFRETRDELTEKDIASLEKDGRQEANSFANENKIADVGKAFRAGDTILKVIDDPNPDNDAMVASELMTFQNVKGTPSDTDLKLSFGIPLSSTIDQALTEIARMVKGGMQTPQREAIKAYMAAKQEELKNGAFEYLDQAQARATGGAMNDHTRKAFLQSAKSSVPGWIYNDWLDMKKERDEGAPGDKGPAKSASAGQNDPEPVGGGEIEEELMVQAEKAGLDFEQILPLMRTESGGDPTIKNKMGSSASGLFQFTDETARNAGLKSAAEYATLPPAEQIRLGLERFKKIGLDENSTRDDFAMANAAPGYVGKSDDTVIDQYKAGTKFGDDVRAKNPGWVPPGGGDITVGSIKAFYRGGKGKSAPKTSALPEPKSELDKSVADILRRAGD